MAIKWGTDSKVEYVEPIYNFPLQIGASGEMSLRVENSRQLLLKLVGTERGITQTALVQPRL
jgi:membrane protease subunit (stomatin/prohibitin family)